MREKQNLVLLPGLLCDAGLWEHQRKNLSELAEIMVGDMTGHDSIAGMGERVLAEAPPRFALAGLSMGGYVAQEIMRKAPERVTKLALLDTSARADTEEQTQRRKYLMQLSSQGKLNQVTPLLLPILVHHDRLQDQDLVSSITAMAERVGHDAFMRQQTAIINRPDGRGDLYRTTCPTLIMCGRQDALTPVELHEEMASGIECARLCIIEDCGHMSTLERPQAVTALLRDWLLYH